MGKNKPVTGTTGKVRLTGGEGAWEPTFTISCDSNLRYRAGVRFGIRTWEGPRGDSAEEAIAALVFYLAAEAHGD